MDGRQNVGAKVAGPELRGRVYELFDQSLCRFGFLGLGSSESLLDPVTSSYEVVDAEARLYRGLA